MFHSAVRLIIYTPWTFRKHVSDISIWMHSVIKMPNTRNVINVSIYFLILQSHFLILKNVERVWAMLTPLLLEPWIVPRRPLELLHCRNETLSIGACKPTFNSSCRYLPGWYISKICFVKQILNFYIIKFSWLHNYNKLEINFPHTPYYAMLGTKYLLFSQMMWCLSPIQFGKI